MQLKHKSDFPAVSSSSEQEEDVVFDFESLLTPLDKSKSGDFQPEITTNSPDNSVGITLLNILGSFATGVVITMVFCVLGAVMIANSPDKSSNPSRCDDPCVCPATTAD